jgi:selenide,water dikinase
VGATVTFSQRVSAEMQSALFDPQTAGGLLISLDPAAAETYLERVRGSVIIGRITEKRDQLISVS